MNDANFLIKTALTVSKRYKDKSTYSRQTHPLHHAALYKFRLTTTWLYRPQESGSRIADRINTHGSLVAGGYRVGRLL